MRSADGAEERLNLAQDTNDGSSPKNAQFEWCRRALSCLAQENLELRQTVLDILRGHIRRTTGEDEYLQNQPVKTLRRSAKTVDLAFHADNV